MSMCGCNQHVAGLDSRSLLNLDSGQVRYLAGYSQYIDDHNSNTLAAIIQHDTTGKQLVVNMRCRERLESANHWQTKLRRNIANNSAG